MDFDSEQMNAGNLVITPPLTRSESADSITSTTSTSSTSSQRPKVYFCEYQDCDKSFSRPSILTEHQLSVHRGIKPYKCDHCKKSFAKKSHLSRHLFSHSTQKPFACSVCDKGVTTMQQLKRHEITHTKSFKCPHEDCTESFYKHPQLRSHILSVHEKKLTCKICDKAFQRPYRLQNHISKHHNPLAVNKYQCDFMSCLEVFSTWSALQQHKKQEHPKLRCDICGRPCVGESGLRNHMIVHDETLVTKNWKCSKCPIISFAKKAQLLEHFMETHQKEIPPELLEEEMTQKDANVVQKTEVLQNEDIIISNKRKIDEIGSIDAEVKIRKYIESGKSSLSLLLNTVGQRRSCPYKNCNRTFKSKEKFDKHIDKHRIHDLKLKIMAEEDGKTNGM